MARIVQSKSKTIAFTQTAGAAKAVPSVPRVTKGARLIRLLKTKRGVSLAGMMKATGWQQHSVRGFLAGTLKKRHGLEAISEKPEDGPRRYRLR
jgi:hypothetical protein